MVTTDEKSDCQNPDLYFSKEAWGSTQRWMKAS